MIQSTTVGGVQSLAPHNTHHSEELLPGSLVVAVGVVFLVEVIPGYKGVKRVANHLNKQAELRIHCV